MSQPSHLITVRGAIVPIESGGAQGSNMHILPAVPDPPEAEAGAQPKRKSAKRQGPTTAHPAFRVDVRGDELCLLRHDTKLNILSAHCNHQDHGSLCRVNRTLNANPRKDAQGRPLGFLLVWLSQADQYGSQDDHHRSSTALHASADQKYSYAERARWRAWLTDSYPRHCCKTCRD